MKAKVKAKGKMIANSEIGNRQEGNSNPAQFPIGFWLFAIAHIWPFPMMLNRKFYIPPFSIENIRR